MHILLITDAWLPQINGVVRTLQTLMARLEDAGHRVSMITPDLFNNIPCPTYPEIRLAVLPAKKTAVMIEAAEPNAIHIATEGPLGSAARKHCLKSGYPFTTAYHTQFLEYTHARTRVPLSWSYSALRRFHAPSSAVMVATDTVEKDLKDNGFGNIRRWTRGVDTDLFKPLRRKKGIADRPISLYVGRVAIEKNIRAFLDLDIPGTKFVVGDGPQLATFKAQYPDVCFTGAKIGKDLAYHYANADVFVFPSRTDTFGLVLLEALASGVPVAAFPVTGPLDVINDVDVGVLDDDLNVAVRRALTIPSEKCREYALSYSWERSVEQFLSNIHVFR